MIIDSIKSKIYENLRENFGEVADKIIDKVGLKYLYDDINEKSALKKVMQMRNSVMLSEIKKLYDLANKLNIEIMLLKGLPDAYDLYPDTYMRPVGDIDILIRERDAVKFSLACGDLGYKYRGMEITKELIETDMSYKVNQHIDKFIKNNGIFSIVIELHTVLDKYWFDYKEMESIDLTEQIFSHKQEFYLGDCKVYICDIYDRLLFSMQHISRHIYNCFTVESYYYPKKGMDISLKTMIDSILLYEKYSEIIDKKELLSRANEYGFNYDIKFANKIIKELTGKSLFSEIEFEEESKRKFGFYKNQIYKKLIEKYTIFDLIRDNRLEMFAEIVNACLNDNKQVSVKYNSNTTIEVDEKIDCLTKERFGTINRCSIQKSDDYRADINISFDKNNLILNFSVTDKVIKLFYSPELWSDHIYTMIYNPNFKSDIGGILIGMIFIPVKGADGKLHIRAEYEGSWMDKRNGSEIGLTDEQAAFTFTDKGYGMNISIPWAILGINYDDLDYLGMDFYFINVDSDKSEADKILCWSNPTRHIDRPYAYGKVFFAKEERKAFTPLGDRYS